MKLMPKLGAVVFATFVAELSPALAQESVLPRDVVQNGTAREAEVRQDSASDAEPLEPPEVSPAPFRREVFRYDAARRPDPFRAWPSSWAGERPAGLTLLGVVVHPDASRSIAALLEAGSGRRHYVREGDRVAGARIVAIGAEGVDAVIAELDERVEILAPRSAREGLNR